jgi:hypothetical protein
MTRDTYDLFDRPGRGRFGDDEIRGNDSVRSDLVDLDLVLHHRTDKGLLVSRDGLEASAVWLPRSACEVVPNGFAVGTLRNGQRARLPQISVTLPDHLAVAKGLR